MDTTERLQTMLQHSGQLCKINQREVQTDAIRQIMKCDILSEPERLLYFTYNYRMPL